MNNVLLIGPKIEAGFFTLQNVLYVFVWASVFVIVSHTIFIDCALEQHRWGYLLSCFVKLKGEERACRNVQYNV